ncbi:hypothetical protein ACH5RR_036288 [Cinchona calisaya]|uniref:Uncharacterized protein n=1 Tax=Cinchona calisaya TaxID=153742 RepID=A0ABD2Y2T0_9GENT
MILKLSHMKGFFYVSPRALGEQLTSGKPSSIPDWKKSFTYIHYLDPPMPQGPWNLIKENLKAKNASPSDSDDAKRLIKSNLRIDYHNQLAILSNNILALSGLFPSHNALRTMILIKVVVE